MTDYSGLVERLRDLHKQATTEKSHFYVAACCRDSISAIEAQRERIERLEGALVAIGNAALFHSTAVEQAMRKIALDALKEKS